MKSKDKKLPVELSHESGDVLQSFEDLRNTRMGYLAEIGRRFGWLAVVRGCLFVTAVAAIFAGIGDVYGLSMLWFILAGILVVSFFIAAAIHETYERRRTTLSLLIKYCDESIARINRDWKKLSVPNVVSPDDRAAVAYDLDLYGQSSLYQLLGTTQLPSGKETLRKWIAYPDETATISKRQQAVEELSKELEWIERFHLRCQLLAASPTGPTALIRWAAGKQIFKFKEILSVFAYASPIIALFALISFATGILNPFVAGCIFVAVPTVNFLLSVVFVGGIHEIFASISSKHREVEHYRTIFSMVASFGSDCEYLDNLKQRMVAGDHDARTHLKSLGLIVWAANLRRHGILFLIYLFLQFFCLWDVLVLGWLEKWRTRNAKYVADWFDALGDWEAVTALGLFKAFNPDWVFPNVNENQDPPLLVAEQLGHPLLNNQTRVVNDVTVGPPGKVLLVTGSNMSGKSTLLRSIGLNAVLAQMGSVVCASKLSMSRVWIESSMRIHDSLSDGVSFFMAELKRLKQIVDVADQYQHKPELMLYLLDEILQGTNSRERHIAVSRVVRHMISAGAIGAVSTHDLELASAEGLEEACNVVHFREHFVELDGKKQMSFDYKMRNGISPTTNALKLLDLVGLSDQDSLSSQGNLDD